MAQLPSIGFSSARQHRPEITIDHALVGYSHIGVGELTTTGQLLADGLDRIQFAGEWASFGFRGYMEGALESGRRAARNLMNH